MCINHTVWITDPGKGHRNVNPGEPTSPQVPSSIDPETLLWVPEKPQLDEFCRDTEPGGAEAPTFRVRRCSTVLRLDLGMQRKCHVSSAREQIL